MSVRIITVYDIIHHYIANIVRSYLQIIILIDTYYATLNGYRRKTWLYYWRWTKLKKTKDNHTFLMDYYDLEEDFTL